MDRIRCVSITRAEAGKLPPIPSGYRTDRVFRLTRAGAIESPSWTLREEPLTHPFVKKYDGGRLGEWLETYLELARPEDLRFIAAYDGQRPVGLLTWRRLEWNNSIWLIDIRTLESRRGEGFGSALIRDLQHVAGLIGARGISVETQTTNYPAICFYQKNGFRLSGLDDHLYSNTDEVDGDIGLFLFWETG